MSGDGNANEDRTSFPACVDLALRIGWRVDVWCWREGKGRIWDHMQRQWPCELQGTVMVACTS